MSGIEGGWPLAFARSLAVAALLSAFGSQVFGRWVLPRVAGPVGCRDSLQAVTRRSLAGAALLLPAWAFVQAADLAGDGLGTAKSWAAVPDTLLHTWFGHVLLAQLAAVLLALVVGRRWPTLALALSAGTVLLQAGHSHAWSMEESPGLLLASDCVHLLTAGVWLGGLLPLLLVVRGTAPRIAASAARWFSPLGKACVVGLVASAGVQFWALVGGLPGLVGTPYGWVAGAKLGLLGVLFAFAVANRYRLAPALLHDSSGQASRSLVRAIAVQAGFGVATVFAAGLLSQLPPGLHEQPVWPFPLRPSLVAMAESELAAEVWLGLAWLAAAAGLLLSFAWRPLRRPAAACGVLAGAVLLAWFGAPHFSLLFVEAYPTSYYTSPSGFAARSIMQGAALYPRHCARCHGAIGQGDGPDARGLPVPPADLTAAHLWDHADGEMFWWLSEGMSAPDGTKVMPGFAGVLSPNQRWALIDAVRARNAGLALQGTGAWPAPVALPQFSVACPGGAASTTEELRGKPIYLTFARAPADSITLAQSAGMACHSADPSAWDALALATGETPETLAGSRLIVDAAAWLRAFRPASTAGAWDDPTVLSAAIRAIVEAPLAARDGGHHHH